MKTKRLSWVKTNPSNTQGNHNSPKPQKFNYYSLTCLVDYPTVRQLKTVNVFIMKKKVSTGTYFLRCILAWYHVKQKRMAGIAGSYVNNRTSFYFRPGDCVGLIYAIGAVVGRLAG